jgi:hypothetical protein
MPVARRIASLGLAQVCLMFLTSPLAAAQGTHFVLSSWPWLPKVDGPEPPAYKHHFSCYDWNRNGVRLNCEVDFWSDFNPPTDPPDLVIDYTGGHLHPLPNGNDPQRPIGKLTSPQIPNPTSTKGFQGFTGSLACWASKTIPEVSGTSTGTTVPFFLVAITASFPKSATPQTRRF